VRPNASQRRESWRQQSQGASLDSWIADDWRAEQCTGLSELFGEPVQWSRRDGYYHWH
jgi:hypothetical protein